MKKLLMVLFVLFSVNLFAQDIVEFSSDTLGNSDSFTFYVNVNDNSLAKLDSVILGAVFTGEIDVDRMIVTKGLDDNGTFRAVATPDTTTLTINLAAAAYEGGVYTASSTGLNSVTGYDKIKVVFQTASSGNDGSDPNGIDVKIFKYFTAMR